MRGAPSVSRVSVGRWTSPHPSRDLGDPPRPGGPAEGAGYIVDGAAGSIPVVIGPPPIGGGGGGTPAPGVG